MKIEIRESSGSVQGIDEAAKTAHIRLVTYDVVDTYGSNWQRGVFDESLATRHIPAVWSHDKTQIFGSVREHDIQSTHVDVSVAFADLDAVPLARTAYSLMKDGHVVDTSFGFARVANGTVSRRDDPKFVPSRPGERERMVKADLIEVSPVLKGAVPGSQVLAVRSADGDQLSLTELEIFQAVAEGRIDVREALRVLEECEPMIVDKDPTTPVTATNVTATGVSGSREVIDLSRLIAERAPHAYRSTNGDVSGCGVCGAQQDAKAHTTTRAAAIELAATPVRSEDAHVLIQAADAAVDTVLGLLAGEDLSDRATAALGLLMAADAMLDRSQDLLNLPDADGEDGPVGTLARAFAVDAQPPTATITVSHTTPTGEVQDDVDRELERLLRGHTVYGFRAEAPRPYLPVPPDPPVQPDLPFPPEQGMTHQELLAACRALGIPVEDRAGGLTTGPQAKLTKYWVSGEGAAKIGGWGHAGDFDSCVAHLAKYVGPERAKGLCAEYHHLATGAWPGHAPGEQGGHH
jgi:HK97 family phage prohead protease